jgi:hypothetical protein
MVLLITWTTYTAIRDYNRENADEIKRQKSERNRLKHLIDSSRGKKS